MDYPCAKFGDFIFSHFGFIVWTDRHTDRITDADDRIAILTRLLSASVTNQYCIAVVDSCVTAAVVAIVDGVHIHDILLVNICRSWFKRNW